MLDTLKFQAIYGHIETIQIYLQTRKGVPGLRGSALVCLSAKDKKINVRFCSPKCPGYN